MLGVLGLLVALGGTALYAATDRSAIATLIRNSEFRSDVLTEAEAVDAVVALGTWGGIGLVAAGASTILVAGAVVVAHGRARRDGRVTPRWIPGVVGAIVNGVLGFVPLSPLLGGAIAGHLHREDGGVGPGTFAGLFTILPPLVGLVFMSVGLFTGLPGTAAAATVATFVVLHLFVAAYFVGLSALGGYLGNRI